MNMRRAPFFLALPLALSGCIATQRDMLDLENQTDELKHQVIDLKQTVKNMQANQADLSVQMKDLNERLSSFMETMTQSQDDMRKLSAKLDDLGTTVTSKVASIGTSLTTAQAKGIEEQKAALARQEAQIISQAGQSTPGDLFHAAEVRLAKKSYDLAAKGFEEYLSKYPKGALADVATYNLGEAYFAQKRWSDAGRQYAIVLEKYPRSEMTASARLKYALSLLSMKRGAEEARQYLESVIADFPTSPEAKAAAAQLKKLAAASAPKAAN